MEEATDIIEQLAGSDTSASLATFQFIPPRHAAHSVPPQATLCQSTTQCQYPAQSPGCL